MANPNPQNNLTDEGRSKGGQNSSGNFKNDPARAAEAGRKGGEMSGGNFKNDPSRAAEAGRMGGEARAQNRERSESSERAAS